ncbi:hypothetical protein BKA70DRAFT_626214 [Coprinopsis sp. MPI-PUGE-AT-0042]|nr:hypothetical protein BKA70DRAFT_626214 [Coprinopsis sp. MPI-PUGE-AT-0042]
MTLNRHRNPSSKHATVPLSSQHLTSNTEGILEYGLLQAQHYHTLVPLALSLDCQEAILSCRSVPSEQITAARSSDWSIYLQRTYPPNTNYGLLPGH